MQYPKHDDTADEAALAGYLAEAANLLQAIAPPDLDGPRPTISVAFEHLRWFELPDVCVVEQTAEQTAPEAAVAR